MPAGTLYILEEYILELEWIGSILMIIGIDIVLGGDNAIVIALACRNLPEKKRTPAIFLGTFLAISVRVFLTIAAVYLLSIPFLQLAGGIFLIGLAFKLLLDKEDDSTSIKSEYSLAGAVRTIVIADLIMGIDNVVAVAGAAGGNIKLVVFGLFISIPIIVWGSKIILYWMERFTALIYIGAGILAFTAGEMIIAEKRLEPMLSQFVFIEAAIPILCMFMVLAVGFLKNHARAQ